MDKTSRGIEKAAEVEPIKSIKDIAKVKQYLIGKNSKRDYMLFVVGINIGLRAGDLLNLRICDVLLDGHIVDRVTINEEKTEKRREFELNTSAKDAITLYLSTLKDIDDEDYLFTSRKGRDRKSVV